MFPLRNMNYYSNMPAAYTCFVNKALILLFFLKGRDAWIGDAKNRAMFNKLDRELVYDLARKAETVWGLKEDFGRFKTFAVGEKVFLLRTKFAAMVRLYLRGQLKGDDWTVTDLIRNVTNLQKMAQELYVFQDELIRLDHEIITEDNPKNHTRLIPGGNCQAAGEMSSSALAVYGYRRQLIAARREHIVKTYLQKEARKPPIDIKKEIAQTFKLKLTAELETATQEKKFVDLAPDFI